MPNNIEYSRLVMKRTAFTGVIPSIISGDTIDNTWSDTDILNAELFFNLEDKKLYTRSGEDVVLLANGTTNLTGSTSTPPLSDVLIVGNTTGTNTIEYSSDLSGSYTNRSVVDKEYVDNEITGTTASILFEAGGTTDLSIKSKIGVNTLTSDSRYSFVFGDGNTVASDYGIIGGLSNTTPLDANSSNVLGTSCVLGTGIYQNVFGRNISSSGDHSFTIGKDHINSGAYSSVLGRENNNTSSYNLISGYQNISTGGTYSSILGRSNSTTSSYVFIAGYNNIVAGTGGAAIGVSNTVSGIYSSTIGGLNNTANNLYATVIGGQNNISSGQHSLSFGVNCTASGNYSVAGGFTNQTTNSNSVAFGNLNQSTGAQSFSVNNTNLASGTNSFAINQLNRASGLNSFVGGYNSTGSTWGNFIHSYNSSVSGNYSSILGGNTNSVTGEKSAIIGGTGNTVGGENSVIVGGNNLTLNKDNYVLVPHLQTNTICEAGTQFKAPTNIAGAIASNTYDFNCDGGMSQVLDLQAATSASTLTFSNPMEGNTYMLIVIQGSGLYNLVLPTGYWLNDTAPFDFTTLADNERAMVTATYLGATWYFAVKELTLV